MAVKYNGIDMRYRALLLFYKNPDLLLNDWFFTDSIYLSGSYYYDLFALSRLPVHNNLMAVFLYVLFSSAALYFSYRLVLENFDVENRESALLLVLLGCFLFFKFLMTPRSSIMGSIAVPNPTAVAHSIAYISLYFILARRILTANILITLVIAIAAKANFILIPIMGLYILFNRDIHLRNLAFMAIPLSYILLVISRGTTVGVPFEDLVKLSEVAIWREGLEAAINLQDTPALILFSSTFFVMPFLIRQFDSQSLRAFAWSVYVASLTVFVFGYLYTWVGYKYFPNPMIVLIAPTRAMKFYTFIFCMMFFAWALKSQALVWYEKIAAIFALILLKSTLTGIAVAAIVATIGVGVPKALRIFVGIELENLPVLKNLSVFFKRVPLPALVTILIVIFIAIRTPTSYPGLTNVDPVAYKHINVWAGGIFADDKTWKAYEALKESPGKEPMLAYYQPYNAPGTYAIHNTFNLVSEKPQFKADPSHHYLSLKKWDEGFLRELVVLEMTRRLNKRQSIDQEVIGEVPERKNGVIYRINTTFEEFYRERGGSVFVPLELDTLFPAALPRMKILDFVLIKFPKHGDS